MINDALVNFIPLTTPLDLGNGVAGDYASSIIDLLGQGDGTTPNNIFGNATYFGEDPGIGRFRPQIEVLVTEAFVGGTSLQVKFQAAPDDADHVASTWTTLVETPAIATASLTLSQVLARFDFPPAFPAGLNPRFLRLLFTTVGVFTAGMVLAPVVMVRDDQSNKFIPRNYAVA